MSAVPRARILVVDDEAHIRHAVKKALERTGYAVDEAASAEDALVALGHASVGLVLCDVRLPNMDGLELLERIRASFPEIIVVMITGYATIESAVTSIRRGAADYLPKPFNPEQLRHVVDRAFTQRQLAEENAYLKGALRTVHGNDAVVGKSPAMQHLLAQAKTLAATSSSVLIVGETGTGKEVLARHIHDLSPRKDHPFVAVNCAAIPAQLLESELFGHQRGAFTGAVANRRGSFELADGGTLFLDEIAEMNVEMQAKILRAIEAHEVKPVGAERTVALDARILAATNKDLQARMKEGTFREDLYWRLNVVQLAIPPLRDRLEDVPDLARRFVASYARELNKPQVELSAEVLECLMRYSWPGNVRELRNAMERAVIFAPPDRPLSLADLPDHLLVSAQRTPRTNQSLVPLAQMELDYIKEVTEACGGNRTQAAEMLGISTVTLWRKLGKGNPGEPGLG